MSSHLRIRADFNGLFGDILCIAHDDVVVTESGDELRLRSGIHLTAFDDDIDDAGQPDPLLATGVVETAPDDLACLGSRWVLRIDRRGVHHASEVIE